MTVKPWELEPDHLKFEASGYPAEIKRTPALGTLCGYVAVAPGHPAYGLHYYDALLDIDVHGGLTYSMFEEDALWHLGFDCAHHSDYMPLFNIFPINSPYPCPYGNTYRDMAFVRGEVERLASQLRAMERSR